MEAVIKLKVSELNAAFLKKVKTLFNEDVEVTISFDEKNSEYLNTLNRSKKDLEAGHKLISFTMEELEEYVTKHRP